jgi:uncharacterized protein (DUF1778 family)
MPKAKKKAPARRVAKPNKDDVVRMRVTAEQKAAMVRAAEADGLELSQWLRQLALRAAGALPGQ